MFSCIIANMPFSRIWFATKFQRHHPIENIRSRHSVTRLSQRLLTNVVLKFYQIGFFFTKHVQIPRFEISGCVQSL
jgi:hypothetical protein